ncbi:MAG TPA: response regulator transcription factor [Jiangellaceae bacterium]
MPMSGRSDLREGLLLFEQQAWSSAYRALSTADQSDPLSSNELETLAIAAHLAGMDEESDRAWARAFTIHERAGNDSRAVRCAFWLAFRLLNTRDQPRSSGWIARIRRLLAERGDCVEHGYRSYLEAMQLLFFGGDVEVATREFGVAVDIGDRYDDADLATLARAGQGRCLIYAGEIDAGLALLDEAMVTVTAGGLSPVVIADTYCTVIEGCRELFDLHRVQVWTSGLSAWCDAQPELVAFRGQCLVDRCEVLRLSGDWLAASAEARRAREVLSTPKPRPPIATAFYHEAELHRLRGENVAAEAAYRRASNAGLDPQPGLAMLRLAQGKVDVARSAIERAVAESGDRLARARLLPAYVEINIAAGESAAAASAAAELTEIAAALRAPLLRAMAATAAGQVSLAHSQARTALTQLRVAESLWTELEAPYHLARVRLLMAEGCAALGDRDGEALEREAARVGFARLGAAGDLAQLQGSSGESPLSVREIEVIRHVAAGESNHEIAEALFISERTVERHVSNIFAKLGINSRAAATAHAYKHGLV